MWRLAGLLLLPASLHSQETLRTRAEQPGVVSRVKVVSDKVHDVSSLEAWKRSFIKEGMTDEEKALAVWKTVVMFQHQNSPPSEYLQQSVQVQDAIKLFNVYGYAMCSNASAHIEQLSRYLGFEARGWAINGHSVPEVKWDGAWHLLDASLINYFPKADGKIASVEEIMAAVAEWYEKNPGFKGNDKKLREFQAANGWTGWRRGPDLLNRTPFFDAGGWWPAGSHGWYATMQEYDGTCGGNSKPFLYEYGYSQGYEVNLQLRPGERLTRNWSNKGLHVDMLEGRAPAALSEKAGKDLMRYTPKYGDLAPARVGNGVHEYDVPVGSPAYRSAALSAENLSEARAAVKDAAKPGVLVLRMPSSYVYLGGELSFKPAGGEVTVSFSDNNGLDWKEIARASSPQKIDLKPLVFRRYDYRLKFELRGPGAGLESLRLAHDVQHSQRALPALDKGSNTITFSAGTQEGTVTIEGATTAAGAKGKQLLVKDFHPTVNNLRDDVLVLKAGTGDITFPLATPGDMVRLRFGSHYRARDARDGWDYQVSFDGGRSWKTVDRAPGPFPGNCKYVTFTEVPAGTREALVRYSGQQRNTTLLMDVRIDADYKEPYGGFRPVKVTYRWEENGEAKENVFVARKPQETYTINCAAKPLMRSIALELAE